jgi:hypothetical protein
MHFDAGMHITIAGLLSETTTLAMSAYPRTCASSGQWRRQSLLILLAFTASAKARHASLR